MLPTRIDLQIIIWKEEDMYIAKSLLLGVVSQGETPFLALENIKEAIELYLEDPDVQRNLFHEGYPLPIPKINILLSPTLDPPPFLPQINE